MEIDLLKLFIFLGIVVIICTLIYEHEPMKFVSILFHYI